MKTQTVGLRAAAVIFGLVALVQLLRLVLQIEVAVSGHPVPFWPSAVAFLVAGGLSFWMWSLSGGRPTGRG